MPQTQEVALLTAAGKLAKTQLLETAHAIYGVVMGTDGETFGDAQMTRSDRILRIVMAASDGALDVLRSQSPRIYLREMQQYTKDLNEEFTQSARVKQPIDLEARTVLMQQAPLIAETERMVA